MGLIAVCTVAYRDKSGEMEREKQVCATGELAHLGSEQASSHMRPQEIPCMRHYACKAHFYTVRSPQRNETEDMVDGMWPQ